MKRLLLLIMTALMLAGCKSNEISFDHTIFNYSEFGITFKYPKEWSIQERASDGNFLLALSKDGNGFTNTSSVLFYGAKPKDMNFVEGLVEEDQDMHILDEKQIYINNQQARQIRSEVIDNDVIMNQFHVIFEDEDKVLVVVSGEMKEDSIEYEMFFDIVSTIKLTP